MDFFTTHPTIIIVILIIIAAAVVLGWIRSRIRAAKRDLLGGITWNDISSVIQQAKEAENNPEPRTVFGATSIYLPKIEKDFAGFHYPDAVSAVKVFVCEYLAVKFEHAGKFKTSVVADNILSMIDIASELHHVSDETVHNVAISGYSKTKEYATVIFQAAVGYKLDGKPLEERYAVEYTLKLRENGMEEKSLICPQCGGAFESTAQTKCPFCGAGIIRDTILSWRFSSIAKS